jgi:virulence-associated protein VapD
MATRKQVAFDMDTAALKEYYPNKSWEHAYDVIKQHMTKNDFQWQQGSVYVSNKPMNPVKVSDILSVLIVKHPWLNVCMRDCVQTNIGKEHSLNNLFDKNANVEKREEKEQPKDKPGNVEDRDLKNPQAKPMSMNDRKKSVNDVRARTEKTNEKQKNKDKER